MNTVLALVKAFAADDSGSPATEYVLLAAAVAMFVLMAIGAVGNSLFFLFSGMSDAANESLADAGGGILN